MLGTLEKGINKLLGLCGLRLMRAQSHYSQRYWSKQQYLERSEFKYVLWLYEIYRQIRPVPGNIVEVGVAYGRNTILFSHLMQMHGETSFRSYYGFDTFDGYNDASLAEEPHLSEKAWKAVSVHDVHRRIRLAGEFDNYHLIEGDVLETLSKFLEKDPKFRAALLYIDCNAYAPAIGAMQMLKEFMSPGGVVCIDEKIPGAETRALSDFCAQNGLDLVTDDSPFSMPAYTRFPARIGE